MQERTQAQRVSARRVGSTLILLASLLGLWLYSPWPGRSSAQEPTFSLAGMTVQTEGARLWAWNPDQVLVRAPGTDRMAEVQAPDGASLTNVRAVVEAAGTMWIVNPGHVYRHVAGTLGVREAFTPEGDPIAEAQGVIGVPECPEIFEAAPMDRTVLLWTADRLLLWDGDLSATSELLSGAAPVSEILGVMPACPQSAWVWTTTALFWWAPGSRQLVEVRAADGSAVAGVNSLITDSAERVWIVTGTKVFQWMREAPVAVEVLDAAGLGLAGAKVLVGHVAQAALNDYTIENALDVWLATADHLYRRFPDTQVAAEILSPSGEPLAGVRGMVGAGAGSPYLTPRRGEVLIWSAADLFADLPGANRTRQITDLSGAPISDIRGVIALPGLPNNQVLIWNGAGLFRRMPGTTVADQVLSADGAALADVRGAAPLLDGEGGTDLWIWSDAHVHVLRSGMPRATEVRSSSGASLAQAWAVVAAEGAAWIRTENALYEARPDSLVAHELRTIDEASLSAPAGGIMALVVYPQEVRRVNGVVEGGPWGASLVNPPLPKPVTFAGPLRGGVDTSMAGSGGNFTTLTAFANAISYIGEIGSSTLLAAPAALLVSNALPAATPTVTLTPIGTPSGTPTPTGTPTATPLPVSSPLNLYLPLILRGW